MMILRLSAITLLITALMGCSLYKPPIQQGTALDSKTVSLIKVGMTKGQVTRALGSPMMADNFTSDRWDYLYYDISTRGVRSEQKNLVLTFQNGKVSQIN